MTNRPDDERLTAFALDELDEAARLAVQRALDDDDEARQTVDALREVADLARDALADEAPLAPAEARLSDEQRDAIRLRAAATAGNERPAARPAVWRRWSIAAGVLVLIGVAGLSATYWTMRTPGGEPATQRIADGEVRGERPEGTREHLAERRRSQESGISPERPKNRGRTSLASEDPPPPGSLTDKREDAAEVLPTVPTESGLRLHALGYVSGEEVGSMPAAGVPGAGPTLPETADRAAADGIVGPTGRFDTEAYDAVTDNPFQRVADEPLSTFSIDVDTASYSNVRRFVQQGALPPRGAVRIEELINYFDYAYEPPADRDTPFATHVEVAGCPWAPEHRLARVGLKGWELDRAERPVSNLVFLIDVSGSMHSAHKLPLLVDAMKLLVAQLDERDRVSIVVYAGSSGLVLEPTAGDQTRTIERALDRLTAGGSTHGSAGVRLAYETAVANLVDGGVNRVILATDGDFNVGTTSQSELVTLIEQQASRGVFLTVLGFGMGNYKDSTMEKLADHGNGNYAYIDTLAEARKVLVEDLTGTLVTIAKDVKIQVEFNPAEVQAYRLIGYENRVLAAQDFNDDTVDAGEIGAGHTVTALYELVPPGVELSTPGVDPLRYQAPERRTSAAASGELMTVKLRYKHPDGDTSTRLELPARDLGATYAQASTDLKFAASVAMFGMLLRDSPYRGTASWDAVLELAEEGLGADRHGYRAGFLTLARDASRLAR